MYFSDIYSVPINTTASSPAWRKLEIAKGTIKEFILYGPDEKADQVHVKVEYHKEKILPFGGVEYMYPFDSSQPITAEIEIMDPPYVLDIYAYNEDDSYTHEYIFGVVLKPVKPVKPGETLEAGWWETIKGVIGVE